MKTRTLTSTQSRGSGALLCVPEYLEPVGSSYIIKHSGSLEETCVAGRALMLPAPILLCRPRSAQSGVAETHSGLIIQSNAFTLKVKKMKSRKGRSMVSIGPHMSS